MGNGGNHSLDARDRANIPASPYAGDSERMEQAKLANASGHELPNGRSPSVTEQDHQTDAAGSAGKKVMALKERGWVALTALAAGYLGGIITAQSAAITLGRTRDSNVAREKFRFA